MTTAEKILRLLKELRLEQKSIARAAGVAYPNFRAYLREVSPSVPGVDVALKIARALNVSVDWLFDDDQDWPPPDPHSPANLGQQELVAELARRRELLRKDMRNIAAEFPYDVLHHLDQIAMDCVFSSPPDVDEPLPIEVREALDRLHMYSALEVQLEWLDPDAVYPTVKLKEVEDLLKDHPHLEMLFDGSTDERPSGLVANALAAQRAAKQGEVPRHDRHDGTLPAQPHPPRSRSRSTPKRRGTGEKPPPAEPKKPKPRTTGKKSAPAKPQRPKRPPRS